ncbi:hypothetical protein [Cohnella hashimotonis]|uniref:Regulatory protein YycH domain-containing protein n=1 Tax=Cohnella hashimotonis TaxID=2826895 RepID=A0ABT6TM06_9BACL|nr:hypothetical protein [Cohnella hashimotonis]MDI4647869.1 hypothetical protein [Cohnella hashimotonis]
MKKYLFVFAILLIIGSGAIIYSQYFASRGIADASKMYENDENDQEMNQAGAIASSDSYPLASATSGGEQSLESGDMDFSQSGEDLDSTNAQGNRFSHSLISELTNVQLSPEIKRLTDSQFNQFVSHAKAYEMENQSFQGWLLTSDDQLVYFPPYYLTNVRDEEAEIYKLPVTLGEHIEMKLFADDQFLILDADKNIVWDISINRTTSMDKTKSSIDIYAGYQFFQPSALKNLKILFGSMVGNSYPMWAADGKDDLYQIDLDNFTLTSQQTFDGWRTLSGYKSMSQGSEYVYQFNSSANAFRKFNLSQNAEEYEFDLKGTPLNGANIVDIVSDKSNIIYILVQDGDKGKWYQTNEKLFHYLRSASAFPDGTTWGSIRKSWYLFSGQSEEIAIYDPSMVVPVKLLPTLEGWEDEDMNQVKR